MTTSAEAGRRHRHRHGGHHGGNQDCCCPTAVSGYGSSGSGGYYGGSHGYSGAYSSGYSGGHSAGYSGSYGYPSYGNVAMVIQATATMATVIELATGHTQAAMATVAVSESGLVPVSVRDSESGRDSGAARASATRPHKYQASQGRIP